MPHKAGHNPKYIKQTFGSRKEKRKAKKQGQRKSEIGIKISNLAKRVASNIEEKLFAIYVKKKVRILKNILCRYILSMFIFF